MKKKVFFITTVLFCLVQATNLVMTFLNDCLQLTEILVENEDSERTGRQDCQTEEWNAFLLQDLLPPYYSKDYRNWQAFRSSELTSYLQQPDTPPPNEAQSHS